MKFILMLFAIVAVTAGCEAGEALKSTKNMPKKMDRMLEEMERTNNTVERQPVVIPFEAMLKEEFGRNLVPIPFDLIPFAREFAKYAGTEELAEIVYIWMKKLNEITLDVANPTPEQVEDFNHKKLHIFSALQAVCGFIPQDKLKIIIREQLYGSGRYQESVLQLLMLRVQFLRDIMLEASLLSEGLTNVGKVERAIEYAEEIEFVSRQPFARDVQVSVTGFLPPIGHIKESLHPRQAADLWQKIRMKTDRLSLEMKDLTGSPGEDERLYRERQARLARAKTLIQDRVSKW